MSGTRAGLRGGVRNWYRRAHDRRAARALERQLDYMRGLAKTVAGREEEISRLLAAYSDRIREALTFHRPIGAGERILEVGTGAQGAIFFWEATDRIGVDPLADHYRELFPWHDRVRTLATGGENLPFADGVFDVVICDNVIDHADNPGKILAEVARVMRSGAALYFAVHVHHPIYHLVSRLHGAWNALGVRLEITPFADHTVHLTPRAAKQLFYTLPLTRMSERTDFAAAHEGATKRPPRHLGDHLKRLFYKNVVYEVIAIRQSNSSELANRSGANLF